MKLQTVHIILIGFKHVGKSAIGKLLAHKINRPFVDLDEAIENLFYTQDQEKKTCREIMLLKGEFFFRHLEHQALKQALSLKPSVISVGGGTPIDLQNQQLLQAHYVIHVKADQGVVFERIMINGRPAFFTPNENPFDTFIKLWERREKIYQPLAQLSIENHHSVEQAVTEIVKQLEECK